jgi:DNA-directed RNA polymerase subunit RPC12/RpoP
MSQNKISCPYCSEQILASAKKCKHCGEFIDKDARTEDVADGVVNTLGSIVWKIIKIILWINVIIFGGVALFGLLEILFS